MPYPASRGRRKIYFRKALANGTTRKGPKSDVLWRSRVRALAHPHAKPLLDAACAERRIRRMLRPTAFLSRDQPVGHSRLLAAIFLFDGISNPRLP